MTLPENGIIHKKTAPMLAGYVRFNLKERGEIRERMREIAEKLAEENIAGEAYCVMQFFSSYTEGFEAEVGFPVRQTVEAEGVSFKTWPGLEVLALTHEGPAETVTDTRKQLHQYARERGLISDEFTRETYRDWRNPQGAIEVQFVVHNWNGLLVENVGRVLGGEAQAGILQGMEEMGIDTGLEERFQRVKGAMERLEAIANDEERYEIISRCAHVYPPGQLEKLREVYASARANGADGLEAVDAVLAFMGSDPGWGERGQYREGYTIYHTKNPADPQAYEAAKSAEEKRAAYCFCPVIRSKLGEGMPGSYCYCGSGWFRQQWEAATGQPVRVEVIKSVLRGDEVCEFAVHLGEGL